MIEPTRLRGVIFDMDGVLVDSEPFLAEAAIRMFAEKGFELKPGEFHPFVGMGEARYLGGPPRPGVSRSTRRRTRPGLTPSTSS